MEYPVSSSQFAVLRLSAAALFFGAGSEDGFERFFKLGFNVDVFEDGEVCPVFWATNPLFFPATMMIGMSRGLGLRLECGDQFRAAHLRHLHVGDDDVGMYPLDDGNSFLAVAGRLYSMATLFKKPANGVPDEHGVIHNQGYERSLLFAGKVFPA